ncbi:MAG: hypothetical protein IJ386_02205 [Clostridia bacterium]|nr:hypothetical protein [Clostridia bacterium]
MRKQKIILTVICVLLMLGIAGLYIWEIVREGKSPTDGLTRYLLVFMAVVTSVIRINYAGGGRKSLSAYEDHFADDIKGAFKDEPFWRKKLLCALRLYCEDNHRKALKYLFDLRGKCKTYEDRRAVGLFTGVVLSDAGLVNEAIYEYLNYLKETPRDSVVLSNLGLLYQRISDNDSAVACFESSIAADEKNPYPCLNLAALLRKEYRLDEAEELALKAYGMKPDFYQAATTLACIYAAKGDEENRKKFYQIAIANGENAGGLKMLIDGILMGEDSQAEE